MVEEKTLWDAVKEYMDSNNLDLSRHRYFSAWSVISGVRLSSCTRLEKVDKAKGRIYVSATSISARSLLTMEKRRILEEWNKMFPDCPIKEVVVQKGY